MPEANLKGCLLQESEDVTSQNDGDSKKACVPQIVVWGGGDGQVDHTGFWDGDTVLCDISLVRLYQNHRPMPRVHPDSGWGLSVTKLWFFSSSKGTVCLP